MAAAAFGGGGQACVRCTQGRGMLFILRGVVGVLRGMLGVLRGMLGVLMGMLGVLTLGP